VNRRDFLRAAAVAPFALRVPAPSAPVALVTCDTESRLAVVDLHRLRVVGSIRTPPDPRSIELVGDVAVVCHTASGLLSIVDRHGVRHVVSGLEEPRYTAAHPDGVHAFVTDSGRSGVVLVDVRRGRVLHRVALPGWARHVTISRDGGTVWAGLGTASEHVAVVHTAPLRHAGLLTPGFPAHDVGHAPDGRLWVTSGERRLVASGKDVLAADAAPQHVTFGAGRVFVTSGDAGTLHMLTPGGRVLVRRSVDVGSYNVQFGANRVVTPSLDHGTLTVLDAHGRVLGVLAVADSCHDACILV
jgi:DNA-binding beta-propeller fold protein YncE